MSAATNKVVFVSKEKGAVVQQGSTSPPEVGDDEILIKNVVVGSNPKGERAMPLTIVTRPP
jgi:hypothetical protein